MRLSFKLSGVFYGWWIVSACFVFALYTGGVIYYGFTAIFEPIANEFGWSYTQISIAASLRGLEFGLLAPLMGLLFDRWGARRLIFGGVIILGLGLILLSRVTSLGMFWGAFAFMSAGLTACSSTILMAVVANWFREKVGIAAGIMLTGFGLGGLLVPLVVRVIDSLDWRMAMFIFGLGIFIIGLPLSLLFRRGPEQYGYIPEGEISGTAIVEEGLTLDQTIKVDSRPRQALASRAFWHIAVALTCQMVVLGATITHVMPYLSSIGIARSTSSLVAGSIPLVSTGGRLGFGWLSDRFDKRRLAAVCFGLMGLGMLFFGYVAGGEIWLLVPFFILFSIGYGGLNTIRVGLIRTYFGRSRFGTINGLAEGVMTFGSMTGPLLPGWVFDKWGSYAGIWFVFAGLTVPALILIANTPPVNTEAA